MPGTIRDPRMNPGNEKNFGIAYVSGEPGYNTGHYFYYKEDQNTDDTENSRYYPFGFPVRVKDTSNHHPVPDIWRRYDALYKDLQPRNITLLLGLDPDVNLDDDHPMAAYLNSAISNGTLAPPSGRGLKKFHQGRRYKYERFLGDMGTLIEE